MKLCQGRNGSGCGLILPLSSFNKRGKGGDPNKPSGRRARCKLCEPKTRMAEKKRKLKAMKNIGTTHGGSSQSHQRVVRR